MRAVASDYHLVFGYYLSTIAFVLLPAAAVLGLLVYLALRRSGRLTRLIAGAWVAWTGAVLVVTLTPGRVSYHPGVCAFFWSGTAGDLGSTDAKILNILMFVPVGFLAALLVRRSWLPLGVALCLSPAIELAQREFPSIRRACDLVDVLDNLGGAVGGAAVGLVLALIAGLLPTAGQDADSAR
jgi:hypothetical protein